MLKLQGKPRNGIFVRDRLTRDEYLVTGWRLCPFWENCREDCKWVLDLLKISPQTDNTQYGISKELFSTLSGRCGYAYEEVDKGRDTDVQEDA